MEEIYLNYQELAFIMEIPSSYSKILLSESLNKEKPTVKDMVKVCDLKKNFGVVRSVDKRYDGQNELIFNLEHKKALYKRYINDKSVIKRKKLSGGKSIFYKILPQEDLDFIKSNLEYKWNYLYGKKAAIQ